MNADQLIDMQEVVEDAKANAMRLPEISFDDLEALVKLGFECLKLREQQRWIPVSERLPEEAKFYLVFTEQGKTAECHYCCDEFVISYVDWQKVTHWMPLPEAPAGEQA